MLTLDLDKQTENRFTKLLNLHGKNYSTLINSMIDYRISELEKGIRNIELDFVGFEKKYKIKTPEFYKKYQTGDFGEESHNNEFMIWSSEYESYTEFQTELKQLL
jgi:adenine specific DNA methylase Mod